MSRATSPVTSKRVVRSNVDQMPSTGPPRRTKVHPEAAMTTVMAAVVDSAGVGGRRRMTRSAIAVDTATIQIAGATPHRMTVAKFAADAIESVPSPVIVGSHRLSATTVMATQASQ